MLREMIRLGARELRLRKGTSAGMVLGVAVALVVFLALESITNGAAAAFGTVESANLIVQQRASLGEFFGSRLPADYEQTLRGLEAEIVVPEIHTVVGASVQDVVLVRGVPLENYRAVEDFEVVEGEALSIGDARSAMVGANVAQARDLMVGAMWEQAGVQFRVKGIFQTGTLADNEFWIGLAEAQSLFGFPNQVSVFVVRPSTASGPGGATELKEAIEAVLPVEVTREGEAFQGFSQSMQSIVWVLRVVSLVMALAAALGVTNVMFTMVRARRREMAILRGVGFGRRAILMFVVTQALLVTALGYAVAVSATLLLVQGLALEFFGISIRPLLDGRVATMALGWTLAIGLAAGAYPALLASRLNIAEMLRGE